MSKLRVDVGQGRREEVQVNPNTTLGYVLDEVCKRRKLDPRAHQLQHSLAGKRRMLDQALTVRFAGLSGNAMLELIEANGRVVHGECTVAVQIEAGQRETAKLNTATTLAEVAARLAPKIPSPCIVYMGRPVTGESLASTTLLTLGVSPGSSALLRLSTSVDQPMSQSAALVAPPATPPLAAAAPAAAPAAVAPTTAAPVATAPAATALGSAANDVSTAPMDIDGDHGESEAAAGIDGDGSVVLDLPMLRSGLAKLETSCADEATYIEAVRLLGRYVANVLAHPMEDKYRTIKRTNLRFHSTLGRFRPTNQLLLSVGFVTSSLNDEPTFELPPTAGLQGLSMLMQLINAASPPEALLPPSAPLLSEGADLAPSNPFRAAPTASLGAGGPPCTSFEGSDCGGSSTVWPMGPSTACQSSAAPSSSVASSSAAPSSSAARGAPGLVQRAASSAMTATELQVAKLKANKTDARPDLSVSRRMTIVLPLSNQSQPLPDVPEEFYELTEGDLKDMSLHNGPTGASPAMQTLAMKELDRLRKLKVYSHALIRVRLPGGILVQACYHPQEPVAHVLALVQSCLEPRLASRDAYLFTTPPRTKLDASLSLVEAGLVPAATAVIAWSAALPAELASLSGQSTLNGEAAKLLNEQMGAEEISSALFPSPIDKGADKELGTSSSLGGGFAKVERGGSAESGSGGGGDEKPKGRPKWFKS
uniref:UBX domain-containing protein n=1 Tax=Haptolina brevifila TaxID=156173 RepID=A0A7S2CLH7_9EUKA|mmetsp:Transcript_26366/g.52955  ORF Transcript_26366/g.52955 Transcript_26366/m.52955 type:complete len:707 (+) Transcript_26366:47-2167(+)|eukprot:CAMPEP_0174710396 /NCGR_PEP_ID=MMETSP1094-20130205/12042_1 /TAXON_ID=156173 /ORGANISM="Chrysochromulina brevifilum, Strain UTEX LB 985" /LENGTH=706 /DNA_ID=CAMNT_0015909201 /DNA_START=45 /DNA_END=2165 /DNA_ORIENTATION=-